MQNSPSFFYNQTSVEFNNSSPLNFEKKVFVDDSFSSPKQAEQQQQ
jgi:hypothetical protein